MRTVSRDQRTDQPSTRLVRAPVERCMTALDVLVLGTGVSESVLSAALARAGKQVLHVDENAYYGGTWASLTLSELAHWAATHDGASLRFPRDGALAPGEIPERLRAVDRHYALALRSALLPSQGPMLEALIRSNVASYATFRLLEHVLVYDPEAAHLERVPSSKSEIFKQRSISLADKRRLMRFMQLAGGVPADDGAAPPSMDADARVMDVLCKDVGLAPRLCRAVQYGVSLCWNDAETSGTALARTRAYLQSLGRFGPGAYLLGQYGGAGELAQGFCRSAAVHGGTFVLGRPVRTLRRDGDEWLVELADVPEAFRVRSIAGSYDALCAQGIQPKAAQEPRAPGLVEYTGIVVTHTPLAFEESGSGAPAGAEPAQPAAGEQPSTAPAYTGPETALVVLPPGTAQNTNAIMITMQGEGTFACPKGQFVYTLTTFGPADAAQEASAVLAPAVARLKACLDHAADAEPAESVLEFFCSRPLPQTRYADPEGGVVVQEGVPERAPGAVRSSLTLDGVDVPRQPLPNPTEVLDDCAEHAEDAFWRLVGTERRAAALDAAQARQRQRDPSEYAGRGGVDPEAPVAASAEVDFFAPRPTQEDEAV